MATRNGVADPESSLLLDDLEIEGFRGFRHVQFPRMARVNLFVGKNNVGKSSLLEAIRVFADRGAARTIFEMLRDRGELRIPYSRGGEEDHTSLALTAVRTLFHGSFGTDREIDDSVGDRARIGPIGFPAGSLSLSLGWYSEADEFGTQQPLFDDLDDPQAALLTGSASLKVKVGGGKSLAIPIQRFARALSLSGTGLSYPHAGYVSANGITPGQIGLYWDRIALTDLEGAVVNALRIIAPDLERLSLVMDGEPATRRAMVAKLRDLPRPVPLRQMGDGVNRILGIVLALVGTRRGVLLVDEIENGIHYSAQPEVWRVIFRMAAALNVQVFATTHSWDCIDAFQQVANAESDIEGMLHRLERKPDGGIRVVDISEEDLAIATRNDIEIR